MENNELEMGYKIEVSAEGKPFRVSMPDGTLIESVQSISELIQGRYLPSSKVDELHEQAHKIFAEDIEKMKELNTKHEESGIFFSEHFADISMVSKINSSDAESVKNEISAMLDEEFDTQLPIYVEGNKLNIVFKCSPMAYLKAFNGLYDRMVIEGNYSVRKQALELAESVDKIYITALKVLDIIDKY